MPLNAGMLISNRYLVDSYIDQGGMQQVWVATDKSLERRVALKMPIVDGARKRFAQSANLSARIRHANIASAFDYINDETGEYYVEELIDGIDLQKCIDTHFPRLDGDTTAHVLHHLAKGLAASHAADVLHRDLKPSNIMVSRDLSFSTIKITDFGIAKLAESEINKDIEKIDAGRTQGLSSTMLGAIPFLAPEVLRKNKPGAPPVGKPADVWSLAAMGYWLLSGEHPFGTGFEAVPEIFKAEHKPWAPALSAHRLTIELVQQLQRIISQCFQLDASMRPTAEELVESIGRLGYLAGKRENGVINRKHDYGGVWFGRSDGGEGLMVHNAEVIAGGALQVGARINFVSTTGHPNRRAVAVLRLKDSAA